MKKSRTRGVKIESLKLPSVVDFAVGELVEVPPEWSRVVLDGSPFVHYPLMYM